LWAYNPVEQFTPIDKLKHHVNLGLASSDLNHEVTLKLHMIFTHSEQNIASL
jgi:hypothetical protein